MITRKFAELPPEYQAGCHVIEKQCRELLTTAKIPFDEIHWDKLNMHNCHLFVTVADKMYSVKFGNKALTHQQEAGMMQSIMIRLKGLVSKIRLQTK